MKEAVRKSKDEAQKRRQHLKANIEKHFHITALTQKEIVEKTKDKIRRFPDSLVVGIKESTHEIIVASDADDRKKAKTKYELDAWALVLQSCIESSIQSTVRLVVQVAEKTVPLEKCKWFYFFVRRLSFIAQKQIIHLDLLLIDEDKIISYTIPAWAQVLDESKLWIPLKATTAKQGDSKKEHNKEDKRQDEIIANLESRNMPCFKEFQINLRGMSNVEFENIAAYRIDVLYAADKRTLGIIELKVGSNNGPDDFAQCLDYYIYLTQVKQNLGPMGWLDFFKMESVDTIKGFVYCDTPHSAGSIICEIYRKLGFFVEYWKYERQYVPVTNYS